MISDAYSVLCRNPATIHKFFLATDMGELAAVWQRHERHAASTSSCQKSCWQRCHVVHCVNAAEKKKYSIILRQELTTMNLVMTLQ
jgi:hypothetical protein